MEKNEMKRDVIFKVIAIILIAIILIHVNANTVMALSLNWGKKRELTAEKINEIERTRYTDENITQREIIGEDIKERELNKKLS